MLGIIYLILSVLIGYEISGILTGPKEISTDTNRIWLVLPASFGTGILVVTWAVYIISWFASVTGGSDRPLLYGNLIVLLAAVLILAFLLYRRKKKAQPMKPESMVSDRSRFRKELVFFGILLVFITYMMFYVFYIKDGVMYAGLTVCSDYAPHTAMMRSFSLGNNFPTQYPHFGGADVKYHFMFQFLAGNLEYLGLRLDLAYNLLSIGSLLGFLMLLYELALRITGRMCCGIWTIILFFFRSGMAFWRFLWEHLQAGDLLTVLQENTAFIGYTENENWGLWNFNVYLNQRHLAFGLLLVTLALYLFMDWLEAGISHEEKGLQWLGKRFTAPEAWKCRQPEKALFMGLFLGLGAFWNGAAVIGGLLILMGFAIFSDGTGLSDHCPGDCFLFFSADEDFYPGKCHGISVVSGISGRGENTLGRGEVPVLDGRDLFPRVAWSGGISAQKGKGTGCQLPDPDHFCIYHSHDCGYQCEPQVYYDLLCFPGNPLGMGSVQPVEGKGHKEDPGGGSGCMPDSDWCLRLRGNIERQRLRTQDRHQYEQRTYRMAG